MYQHFDKLFEHMMVPSESGTYPFKQSFFCLGSITARRYARTKLRISTKCEEFMMAGCIGPFKLTFLFNGYVPSNLVFNFTIHVCVSR